MSRDHRKLRVFALADDLVIAVYQASAGFPAAERFGLQAQIRRAAISTASNIVEGSARRTTREYVNFLNIAAGSASEARYLAELSARLGFLTVEAQRSLTARYTELIARLQALLNALSHEP
jgi:four helix bundle protein